MHNSQKNKGYAHDASENYEIPLECIEVNLKEDFIGGGNQSSVFKGRWNGR